MKQIHSMMLVFVLLVFTLLVTIVPAYGELAPWDCPDCERRENKENYCGECGYPAPWTDPEAWKATVVTVDPEFEPFREVASYVTFGSYEQDNNEENGREPVEWIVLDYDAVNNRALLLSRYGLDVQPFNTEDTNTTWEKCTLRTWLNGTFLNNAFTAEERERILLTKVDNSIRQGYNSWFPCGNNTQDQIFLLSYAEANEYLGVTWKDGNNMNSRAAPTAYAMKQGAYTSYSDETVDGIAAGRWWLRSIEDICPKFAYYVFYDGSLCSSNVDDDDVCVRPAMWIDLGADRAASAEQTAEPEQWNRISSGKNGDQLIRVDVMDDPTVPDENAADETDYISDHITVQIFQDSEWKTVEQSLLYSHENGAFFDGMPGFGQTPPPQIKAGSDPFFRIIHDSYVEDFSSLVTYYDYSYADYTLTSIEDEEHQPVQFSQLPEGTYLAMIRVNGSHGEDYYSGQCLVWVTK